MPNDIPTEQNIDTRNEKIELPSIFLQRILAEAAQKNASGVHLVVGSRPQMRIDDKLVIIENEGIVDREILEKILNVFLIPEELEKLKKEKEISLVKIFGSHFRYRVNIFYQKEMLSLSFYYIQGFIPSLADLNLPAKIKNITEINKGLLIIGGPFNSGKTTTAASIIEEINKNCKKHIITFENPVEYFFVSKESLIEQRQIGRDVNDLVTGLDYSLKEDVDVIFINVIGKDFDLAIEKIFKLASGNTLIILELDTDNSIKAIQELINKALKFTSQEAACYNLADILVGIITQKLLPRLGGGMAMAAEVLIGNEAVKTLIRQNRVFQIESILQTSREEGMISMGASIENLIKAGEIKNEKADFNSPVSNNWGENQNNDF